MRVLMTTTGYPGHALPLVPFAEALARAGHDVCVAGPRSRVAALTRLGIDVCGCARSLSALRTSRSRGCPWWRARSTSCAPVSSLGRTPLFAADQWHNARRVAEAGAGIAMTDARRAMFDLPGADAIRALPPVDPSVDVLAAVTRDGSLIG